MLPQVFWHHMANMITYKRANRLQFALKFVLRIRRNSGLMWI